ncbi:hypothetical protein GCM10022403_094800 [Streptomyces coacervatus]|uniref:MmyB-like transcription regulator ligand binding domain-containing protein n=1 Tax=Streptomyces coacervatus TaxID=647381 RepID=A0ABP7JMD4_9ACTN
MVIVDYECELAQLEEQGHRTGLVGRGRGRAMAQLLRRSREFDQLWQEREVALRRVDRKRIVHPSLGMIELDCHNLFSEDGRQRLLWFSAPPGSAGAEQLELLSVVGTQDFAV